MRRRSIATNASETRALVFYKDKVLALMLRHHQVLTEAERKARVANGSVHSLAQSLREVRWENLALRMAAVGKSTEDM